MNDSDKKEMRQAERELAEASAKAAADGIGQSLKRLKQLLTLDAPLPIIENETRLIRWRALSVLQAVETHQAIRDKNAIDLAEKLKGEPGLN